MQSSHFSDILIPDWNSFNPESEMYSQQKHDAFNYIRMELSPKDLKNETLRFLRNRCDVDMEKAEKVEDWKYITVGKYCWMINNGAMLDKETDDFFTMRLADILKIIHTTVIEPLIKKRVIDIAKILFEDMEDLIILDNISNDGTEAYQILVDANPTAKTLVSLNKYMKEHVVYLKEYDKDEVEEAYPNMNIDLVKWSIIQRASRTYNRNSKQKRKITSGDSSNKFLINNESKITCDMQFQKEDTDLQLVSISPALVIKAKTLLMFNTHTRRLSILYADSKDGLEIRGTTIHNFDEKKSFCKILRNPGKQLASIKNATLQRAEMIMNEYIKGKSQSASGRTNNHTILIKVW